MPTTEGTIIKFISTFNFCDVFGHYRNSTRANKICLQPKCLSTKHKKVLIFCHEDSDQFCRSLSVIIKPNKELLLSTLTQTES